MDVANMTPRTRTLFNAAFVVMLIGLPLATVYFAVGFVHFDAALVFPDRAFWSHVEPPSVGILLLYLAWIGFQAALFHWLPGRTVEGEPLPDGRRLEYRLNGLLALAVTLGAAGGAVALDLVPATIFHDTLGALVTTANVVVLLGCVALVGEVGEERLAVDVGPSGRRGLGELAGDDRAVEPIECGVVEAAALEGGDRDLVVGFVDREEMQQVAHEVRVRATRPALEPAG